VWQLFSAGRACGTVFLWASYFVTFMILATSGAWTPNLLQRTGIVGARSSLAVALFALGSVFGTPLAGFLVSRFTARRVLPAALVAGALTFAALGHAGQSIALVVFCLGLAGFFLGVASSGLVALGPLLYSTAIRSTGVGWAMGLGRLGAIVDRSSSVCSSAGAGRSATPFAALGIPALCAALFTRLIAISRPHRAADSVAATTGEEL
jgi:AAHS family 4-hydroxybenzoate transporter-like MFS transporter